MKRMGLVLVGALLCGATLASAGDLTVNENGVNGCDQIHFGDQDDDRQVARSEDDFTLPVSGAPLKVIAAKNGGVSVRGSQTDVFKVRVCKGAYADTQQAAQQLLSQIQVNRSGGTLEATGPSAGNWTAFLLIEAPQNAAMDVSAYNGPISLKDLSGKITASAKNGPLAMRNLHGTVDANVENGPIAFSGSSGEIKLKAHNGPISVKLEGDNWNGAGLDAQTVNGPLAVRLPNNYNSGVEIATSGHAPVSCHAKGCESVQRTEEGGVRHMTLGNGSPMVRLSSDNGPVMVSDSQDGRAEY